MNWIESSGRGAQMPTFSVTVWALPDWYLAFQAQYSGNWDGGGSGWTGTAISFADGGSGPGGAGEGGNASSAHAPFREAFDEVSELIENAATNLMSKALLDCWAGMESAYDVFAKAGSHRGLFQLSPDAWRDSGIGSPYAGNVLDAGMNAKAAAGYLTKLIRDNARVAKDDIGLALTDYRYGASASWRDSTYADRIMKCAELLGKGNWDAAMTALGK